MSDYIYFKIQGAQQGLISAGASGKESLLDSKQADHEDEIWVQAFKHVVARPVDPQTGLPAGSRTHQPMSITKYLDKSSPLLYAALVTGEQLTECTLTFYRDEGT